MRTRQSVDMDTVCSASFLVIEKEHYDGETVTRYWPFVDRQKASAIFQEKVFGQHHLILALYNRTRAVTSEDFEPLNADLNDAGSYLLYMEWASGFVVESSKRSWKEMADDLSSIWDIMGKDDFQRGVLYEKVIGAVHPEESQ